MRVCVCVCVEGTGEGGEVEEKGGEDEDVKDAEETGKEGGGRGGKEGGTHRGLCFFLQSHMRTVFCIMIQAPARYRILFFTGGDKEGRKQRR